MTFSGASRIRKEFKSCVDSFSRSLLAIEKRDGHGTLRDVKVENGQICCNCLSSKEEKKIEHEYTALPAEGVVDVSDSQHPALTHLNHHAPPKTNMIEGMARAASREGPEAPSDNHRTKSALDDSAQLNSTQLKSALKSTPSTIVPARSASPATFYGNVVPQICIDELDTMHKFCCDHSHEGKAEMLKKEKEREKENLRIPGSRMQHR
jgi:hypothetical protein